MEAGSVFVSVPSALLEKALHGALAELLPDVVVENGSLEQGASAVVVTTPAACSPAECRRLAAQGTRIIVISPIPMAVERELYEGAGAYAYLPMQIDATHLLANAVKLALAGDHGGVVLESRTAFSQDMSSSAC
ncbi:MAG: hypothetical protein IT301_10645 [Dehalococcoidia bacterium]|nr:hypothetical protein [Dehalococcoidia bacterium]